MGGEEGGEGGGGEGGREKEACRGVGSTSDAHGHRRDCRPRDVRFVAIQPLAVLRDDAIALATKAKSVLSARVCVGGSTESTWTVARECERGCGTGSVRARNFAHIHWGRPAAATTSIRP